VPVAIVPVITWNWIDIPRALVVARHPRSRSSLCVSWDAVIRWLLIARQEAVSVPAWRRPFMSRRSRRDDRQQPQDDSNQWKHEARHQRTIDGRLLRGDSNLVRGAAQLLPVRLRNERFEAAVLKEVLVTPETRRCSEREKVDLFISYARTMHSVLAVPKNEQPRITIASQWRPHGRQSPRSILAYPRSIPTYPGSIRAYLGMPDNGKKNFSQPSVAFWTHSSRLSRRQETGRLWN
jgi:hypothetical protein